MDLDLDDYLQEGWINLFPPADWLIAASPPTQASTPNEHSDADRNPDDRTWIDDLFDGDDPLIDRPITWAQIKHPISINNTLAGVVQPPHDIFGYLPSRIPSAHPVQSDIGQTRRREVRQEHSESIQQEETYTPDKPDSERSRLEKYTGWNNPLWDLTFRDISTDLTEGYRGPNPLGHFRNSRDYFVVLDEDIAYDHKRSNGVTYNPCTYLMCEAGIRSDKNPEGPYSDREKLLVWHYAKAKGYLSDEPAPAPYSGLIWYALEYDIIDRDHIESTDGAPLKGETLKQTVLLLDNSEDVTVPRAQMYKSDDTADAEKAAADPGEADSSHDGTSDSQRSITEGPYDVDHLVGAFGTDLERDADADHPTMQFYDRYIESSEVKEEWATVGDIRTAYNNWVKIQKYAIEENDLDCEIELNTISSGGLGGIMSARLSNKGEGENWDSKQMRISGTRASYLLNKKLTETATSYLLEDLPEPIDKVFD